MKASPFHKAENVDSVGPLQELETLYTIPMLSMPGGLVPPRTWRGSSGSLEGFLSTGEVRFGK